MLKNCPLCQTEMPERYNYCYQCGEYVGQVSTAIPVADPEAERQHHKQERLIHYGCFILIAIWAMFGLWFCFTMNL